MRIEGCLTRRPRASGGSFCVGQPARVVESRDARKSGLRPASQRDGPLRDRMLGCRRRREVGGGRSISAAPGRVGERGLDPDDERAHPVQSPGGLRARVGPRAARGPQSSRVPAMTTDSSAVVITADLCQQLGADAPATPIPTAAGPARPRGQVGRRHEDTPRLHVPRNPPNHTSRGSTP